MVKFTNSYSAANLLRNGNFDLLRTEDGETVAAFWDFGVSNATAEYLTDQPLEQGNSDRQVRMTLQNTGSVSLVQYFVRANSMTFPDGLDDGEWRSIPGGYKNVSEVYLPPGRYSLAFSIKVVGGDATVTVDSSATLTAVEQGLSKTVSAFEEWQRFTLNFESSSALTDLVVEVSRATGEDLSEVRLALISLSSGTYTSLPFTPDPITACWPEGTIVMTLGDSCPPGFEELGEDGLTPLSEWTADNPDSKARLGNFPRNASGLTGTETHTKEGVDFDPGTKDILEVPDLNNDDTLVTGGVTAFDNPSIDLPGSPKGEPDHQHTLSSEGTRPVSWAFRLCKRL